MAIIYVCGALLVVGLAIGVAWSGAPFVEPDPTAALTPVEVARRFARLMAIALTGGILAGITVIGAGGRLAMRLLAVTAGGEAQGRITEADEVVGEITTDGTIGFVIFNGIFGGVAAALLYLLVRRFLPTGRLAGVTFGLALLVVFGATIDPLRKDNPDFDLVGPGWLAVVVFTMMAIAFGLTLQACVTKLSAWLPPLSWDRRVLARYIVPIGFAIAGFSITAFLVVAMLVVVVATRWTPIVDAVRSERWRFGGRLALAALTLAFAPGAIGSIVDIAGR